MRFVKLNPSTTTRATRALFAVLAVLALLGAGCASSGGGSAPTAPAGPSDQELITQVINSSLAALQAKDIPKMMTAYADDFASDQGDKAGMTEFLTTAASQGFLDGMTANVSALAVTVTGATAKATGVAVEGAFGALNLAFDLAKRDGQWIITGQTQQ